MGWRADAVCGELRVGKVYLETAVCIVPMALVSSANFILVYFSSLSPVQISITVMSDHCRALWRYQ